MSELTPIEYCVAVLWMHGESSGRIARAVNWTRDKVRGFVWRHFDERPRGTFTIEERQAYLDAAADTRVDNGRLRKEHFVAKKTVEMFLKEKEKPAEPEQPDLNTRAGRRRAREIKREQAMAAEKERRAQEARQAGHATARGRTPGSKEMTRSSALEFLFDHHLLRDRDQAGQATARETGLPEEQRRFEAGLRLRAWAQGAQTADLGAIDYERATMGSSGGAPLGLAAFRLHCIQSLNSIRAVMGPRDFSRLRAIVEGDEFLWDRLPPGSRARGAVFEAVRKWLDAVGVHESLMTPETYADRWAESLPEFAHPKREVARRGADALREILEAARA